MPETSFNISSLAGMSQSEVASLLSQLTDAECSELLHDWRFLARPEQLEPLGQWSVWLVLAGRGFGKTRTSTEWARSRLRRGYGRLALVAETAADARDVLVEGPSGMLAVCQPTDRDHSGNLIGRPLYEPSKRRLTWENGAVATTYSGDDPEQLRGPEHDTGVLDELAKYRHGEETMSNLLFGLRISEDPRAIVATTPRPRKAVIDLVNDPSTYVTRGSTYDNRANLAKTFIANVITKYEGTRRGRQELDGVLLLDTPGALWNTDMFIRGPAPAELVRVVVGVDPSGAGGDKDEKADEIGIVVAGKDANGFYYILEDATMSGGPLAWAKRVRSVYLRYVADRVVAEVNYGGAMVESTIRSVDPQISYKAVTATRGKVQRAEPVAALYEQGRVVHVGNFAKLEDQMIQFSPSGYSGSNSPDRADAAIWAITDLMGAAEAKFW